MLAVAIEGNNIWVGTAGGGLVKIDKTTGIALFYNKANSGLPDNYVNSIAIDGAGNKWIGTMWGGLSVYNQGGVIDINDIHAPDNKLLVYPNPARDKLTVVTHGAMQTAAIYTLQGQLVKSVKLKTQSPKCVVDITDLPSGLYVLKLTGNKSTKVVKFLKE